jgi:glycosyltransferase involved in cell wall biosynthesis
LNPLFSIIIPCYNQAHFLSQCLDSLLEQGFINWEAIVVNDGSTDNTDDICQKYATVDSRIKILNKTNGGLSSARNFGIANALGNRFIFLDADDFLYPNCLETVAKAVHETDDTVLVQYGYTYIKENGKDILSHTIAQKKNFLIPDIFNGNLGPCHSICISRTLALAAGSFDESLKSVEDWDFWIRAVKAGGTQKIISEKLVYYRYAKNSMSRDGFVMFDALKKVIERGPKKDLRITIESELNRDYSFNSNSVIQQVLLRSLGVSIMQGKIDESIQFLKENSPIPLEEYKAADYEYMCSYLSFRYWYSPSDIKEVFESIVPNFKSFFAILGYSKSKTNRVIYHIFKRHYYYGNIFRYGKFLGRIVNFIFRNYYQKLVA